MNFVSDSDHPASVRKAGWLRDVREPGLAPAAWRGEGSRGERWGFCVPPPVPEPFSPNAASGSSLALMEEGDGRITGMLIPVLDPVSVY